MYRGFKITKETISSILNNQKHVNNREYYRDSYNTNSEIIKNKIKKNLDKYLTLNNKIDVTKLKDDWFPIETYDVFLSHSHKDIADIEILAGYLMKEKGLKVFVDSFIWGYYIDLLKNLNKEYNRIDKNDKECQTYDYDSANWCSSNVTIILNSALQEVIDNSEAIFFYNTPNSITHDYKKDTTQSPWIFSEIETTRIIRKKTPQRIQAICENVQSDIAKQQASFNYELKHKHLVDINSEIFNKWMLQDLYGLEIKVEKRQNVEFQLDQLYKIIGD